ncbi:AAA family ATPase [Streptomyces viridochromogenes]|uniref:AAA family ATPase n=1 Tax=Streptomyces viridochromogenes TaxID=1938 RepID=UPI000A527207|nr:AAA family ATPase [Streptomyces viridochromogenes]
MSPIPNRETTVVVGREDELDELGAALRDAGSRGRLLAVHGQPGVGKTTLAEAALRPVARDGHLVIRLRPGPRGTPGLDSLVDQVCALLAEEGGSGAAVRAAALRRGRHGLALMLRTLSAVIRAAGPRPLAVLFDDAHRLAAQDRGPVAALLLGLRSAGACVLVCGVLEAVDPSLVRGLAGVADRTLELPPLTVGQCAELISSRLGVPPAAELVAAVRRGLGPDAGGNPGAVMRAVDTLRERDRLVVVDERVYLADPRTPILLPLFQARPREWLPSTDGRGSADDPFPGEVLALLTRLTGVGETTVDDYLNLAPELGTTQDRLGRLLDTLVSLELVAVDDRQRLTCTVPAAAELPAHRTEDDVARLHVRLVLNAYRPHRARPPAPRLVDHALAAGTRLLPPLRTELLLAAVREQDPQEPLRTLGACRALLDELPADDAHLPRILHSAVPLLLRHGLPAELLALGTRLLPRLAPGAVLAQLAQAWALAAVHDQWLGLYTVDHDSRAARVARRMPEAVALVTLAARLHSGTHRLPSDCLPVFADGSAELPSADEAEVLIRALNTWTEGARGAARAPGVPYAIREALGLGDLASCWATLPGKRPKVFPESPLHVHQALVREYLTGSWDVALSLAGSLEAGPGATGRGPLYLHSRALAAEICRRRGDLGRAAAWLDRVADGAEHLPLLSWARAGLLHGQGDTAGAWRQGRRDCDALWRAGRTAGLERPLLRVLCYASRDPEGVADAGAALEQLEELDTVAPSRLTRAALLLGRGLARDDVDGAVGGYRLLDAHGGRQAAFSAAVWLLRRTGEQRWLREAWRQHEGMASRPARKTLVRLAAEFRLVVPRPSGDRLLPSRLDLRIVEMVAGGSTNRQIATALARSEKSIEAHLAKIFRCTGRRSRVALATAWLDGGLPRTATAQGHCAP